MSHFLTEDQISLRDTARRFAEGEVLPRAAAIDREDKFDRVLYRGMAALGLFGVSLPEAAGGSGFDTVSTCLVMEELARCSGAIGNAFAIPVEAALFLHHHGNESQKALIPGILDGSVVMATAMSEPDFGSDVASITTTARAVDDGWVLNGTKAWVTLGGVADRIMVFARTGKEAGHKSISCFMVDAHQAGVSRGKNEELLGMHGLEDCQIVLQDVHVPRTALIGAENQAFKTAMGNFNFSRLLMSSMALGMAQAAMEDAVAYATTRKQFGQAIMGFQAIQFMGGRHGDRHRRRAPAHPSRCAAAGRGPFHRQGRRAGQALHHRHGHAPRVERAADPRRQRLLARLPHRAPVPGTCAWRRSMKAPTRSSA